MEGKTIAVAIVHGIGRQRDGYAAKFQARLEREAERLAKSRLPKGERMNLVIEPILWAPVVDKLEDRLLEAINLRKLYWKKTRELMITYIGDAIAYQLPARGNLAYEAIHLSLKAGLKRLSDRAGPEAPLCVIAHSLGTILTVNYFREQGGLPPAAGVTPLMRGDTLAQYYSIGSPIAIWSLIAEDFGVPIPVPAEGLKRYHPGVEGVWRNIFFKSDVLGYPLGGLNARYRQAVRDMPVSSGNPLLAYLPISHNGYWRHRHTLRVISNDLLRTWTRMSPRR